MSRSPLLTTQQDALLRALGRSRLTAYVYWTGGTLLAAYYFHHRRSLDLDFFSPDLLDAPFVDRIVTGVARAAGGRRARLNRYPSRTEYFLLFGREELKVEVVYFPFPALGRRIRWTEYALQIDSLRDIAANKAHAITERSEPKDAFDLCAILRTKRTWSLPKILGDVEKKFGVTIDPVHFGGRVLAAVDLMERLRPLLVPGAPTQKTLREFFDREAQQRLREALGR